MKKPALLPTLLALTGGLIAGRMLYNRSHSEDLTGEVVLVTGEGHGGLRCVVHHGRRGVVGHGVEGGAVRRGGRHIGLGNEAAVVVTAGALNQVAGNTGASWSSWSWSSKNEYDQAYLIIFKMLIF